MHINTLFTVIIMSLVVSANAQLDRASDLYKQIVKNDSLIFQVGFNKCQIEPFERLVAEDLIFYHDKSGITDSKESFIAGIKNGLCANPEKFRSRRELIDATLQVYPLHNNGELYGAIQIGEHFFYEKLGDSPEKKVGLAKFTNTWLLQDGIWKLTNVLSYDHRSASDPREKAMVSHEILSNYIGTYNAPNSGTVTISICEEGLMLHTKKMSSCLLALSENSFYHIDAPLTFTFVNDDQGKVLKMIVRENDKIVEEAIKQSIIKTKKK